MRLEVKRLMKYRSYQLNEELGYCKFAYDFLMNKREESGFEFCSEERRALSYAMDLIRARLIDVDLALFYQEHSGE